MNGHLVDANVILDIFLDDPDWTDWSVAALANASYNSRLYINQIVYAEVSIGFDKIEELESALHMGGFQMLQISKEALFLAGKAYLNYKRGRYRTYFLTVRMICPE